MFHEFEFYESTKKIHKIFFVLFFYEVEVFDWDYKKRQKKDIRNYIYRKFASTSSFPLEAHAGFLRLSMKGKFDGYYCDLLGKVDFQIINTWLYGT